MKTIYLVYADAAHNHNKFWSGTAQDDGTVVVKWGRIGYQEQIKVHQCGSYSGAIAKFNQLVTQKKAKGYQESAATTQDTEIQEIARAQNLLITIREYVKQKDVRHTNYLSVLNEFLCIIPTPLGMRIRPDSVYRDVAQVDRQIDILKEIRAQNSNISNQRQNSQLPAVVSLKSISKNFWRHLSPNE